MKRPDIEAIKARSEAATPGPWIGGVMPTTASVADEPFWVWSQYAPKTIIVDKDRAFRANDGRFIAHSRQDIPDLLAYIAELEARLAPTVKDSLTLEPDASQEPVVKQSLTTAQPDYTSETEDLTTWPQTRGPEWRRMADGEEMAAGDVGLHRPGALSRSEFEFARAWVGRIVGSTFCPPEAWTRRPAPEAQP